MKNKRFKIFAFVAALLLSISLASCQGDDVSIVILFDSNGGETVEALEVDRGIDVELPSTSKAGYTFTGWHLESDLSDEAFLQGSFDSHEKLYASYEINTYKINYELTDYGTFSYNGKTLIDNPSTYTIESNTISLQNPIDTSSSMYFHGYYDNPDFEGYPITSIESQTTGDITLYARYLPVSINYHYDYDLGGYVIDGVYNTSGGDLIIPETYKGEPVVAISAYALDSANLGTLEILSENMMIDSTAFINVTINKLTIPSSTRFIYNGVDSVYEGINYAIFSSTSIGELAFTGEDKYILVDGFVLSSDQKTLYTYTQKSLSDETITIPDTVINIEPYAFVESHFTQIYIPSSVTHIGEYAFAKITGSIVFDENTSIKEIPNYGFYNSWLTDLTLFDSLESIGDKAFYNSRIDSPLIIPSSITYIGASAFEDFQTYDGLTIENNLDSQLIIDESAFKNSDISSDFSIPVQTVIIGKEAFEGTQLTSINIHENVEYIGEDAFKNINSLTEITITGDLVIKQGAFANNHNVTILTIVSTDNIYISSDAFSLLTALESITLSGQMTLEEYSFSSVNSLNALNLIGDEITINDYAFLKTDNFTVYSSLESFDSDWISFIDHDGLSFIYNVDFS